jgi:hypothetical protein
MLMISDAVPSGLLTSPWRQTPSQAKVTAKILALQALMGS